MSNVNSVVVSGNLTRDPELRSTTNGTSVVNLGIAVNRSYKSESAEGGYAEEVSFFDVTVWGGFGELVARKLRKGDSATIQGRLKQDTWETDTGEKRSKVQIIADQIDSDGFFRSKDEDNTAVAAPAETAPASTAATSTNTETPALPSADDIPF